MKPPVLDNAWPSEVRALYEHDRREIWDRSIAPHIWNQYHNQLDLYFALAGEQPKDVLDVGCAQATLALLLAEAGHRVCAVDIRQHFIDYAQSRYSRGEIEFRCGDVFELTVDRTFDLIFANQLLEHLVYPEVVVERLTTLLRPNGRLVVTTPNHDYLMNRLPSLHELGERSRWEHRQHTADGDGHFFAYRAKELVRIFRSSGLRGVSVRYFESPFVSGHMKVRHAHGMIPPPVLRLLDRGLLATPVAGRKLAHQLMVIGTK